MRNQRPDVCHRCGWTVPVSKLRRVDRKRLNTSRSFGCLCDDCKEDLMHLQKEGSNSHSRWTAKLKAVRHRDVA
jgi:hypothetical protein